MENGQDVSAILAASGVAVTLLTTLVIGATELIKRIFDRDYRAATIIGVSVIVGGLGGLLLFEELGLAIGMVIGLSASGLVTTVQKFGQGTVSQPTVIDRR
jgi:hypothetical protein